MTPTTLPAIPEPATAPVPALLDACEAVVMWADQCDEGGFRVKRRQFATLADDSAVRARNDVVQRNQVLRPLMEEHGFATAGEAIAWLQGEAA